MSTLLTMTALAVIIGFVALAKRGRGRKRGRVRPLKVSESLALLTASSGSVTVGDYDSVVNDTTFLISQDAVWSLGGHTAGEGPITVGIAHSDYTNTEIGEWFAATGQWDQGDLIAQEIVKRKIRLVGVFPGAEVSEALNDGQPIKTRIGFNLEEGDTMQTWAVNGDASALTTGSLILTEGTIWARK